MVDSSETGFHILESIVCLKAGNEWDFTINEAVGEGKNVDKWRMLESDRWLWD